MKPGSGFFDIGSFDNGDQSGLGLIILILFQSGARFVWNLWAEYKLHQVQVKHMVMKHLVTSGGIVKIRNMDQLCNEFCVLLSLNIPGYLSTII